MSDFQSGKTTVSGSVTTTVSSLGVPLPVTGQTMTIYNGTGQAAEFTLHTVTAGKVAYVMSMSVSGTANGYGALKNNAGTTQFLMSHLANTSETLGNGLVPVYKETAGNAIKFQATNTTTYYNVVIIEVTA